MKTWHIPCFHFIRVKHNCVWSCDVGLMDKEQEKPVWRQAANDAGVDSRTAAVVLAAIASLRYGTVEVVVHDGRVVQVDKRERIRIGVPQG